MQLKVNHFNHPGYVTANKIHIMHLFLFQALTVRTGKMLKYELFENIVLKELYCVFMFDCEK